MPLHTRLLMQQGCVSPHVSCVQHCQAWSQLLRLPGHISYVHISFATGSARWQQWYMCVHFIGFSRCISISSVLLTAE
jgi:hypothetical protein